MWKPLISEIQNYKKMNRYCLVNPSPSRVNEKRPWSIEKQGRLFMRLVSELHVQPSPTVRPNEDVCPTRSHEPDHAGFGNRRDIIWHV